MPAGGEAAGRRFYGTLLGRPELPRPDVPLDGLVRAFVDDPFGTRVELLQRLP